MNFFKKLFGSSKKVEKSNYEIGYKGTSDEMYRAVAGSLIIAPTGIPDAQKDLLRGAIDAMKEGRSANLQLLISENITSLPLIVSSMAEAGAKANHIKMALEGYAHKDKYVNAAFQQMAPRDMNVGEKVSAMSTLLKAGAIAGNFNNAAIAHAIVRHEQPVIDLLLKHGADLDDAFKNAKEQDKNPVAAEGAIYRKGQVASEIGAYQARNLFPGPTTR